jgi:hypothetical protein
MWEYYHYVLLSINVAVTVTVSRSVRTTFSRLVSFCHSLMHKFRQIVPMDHFSSLLLIPLSLSDGQLWRGARGGRVQAKTPALLGW